MLLGSMAAAGFCLPGIWRTEADQAAQQVLLLEEPDLNGASHAEKRDRALCGRCEGAHENARLGSLRAGLGVLSRAGD